MKEGWKYCTLSDCCNINYGTRVVRSKVSGSKYPVYGGGGETFRMDDYNREDCLVVARFAMSKQCTRVVKGKFFLNDSGLTVSPKEASKLLPLLVEKYLLASNDIIYSFGRGSAQRNLNMAEFRSMVFSYPESLTEQQRIVEYLDASFAEIDALKAKAAEEVANAKAMFDAALREEMTPKEGWEEKILKDITTSIGDGLHSTPKYNDSGDYFFINGNNLENGNIIIKADTKKVDEDEYNKYKIDLNDSTVLLSINGTIGKTSFYNGEKVILGKSACYINVDKNIQKEYLRYFLMSDLFFKYVNKNARQATIKNLGLKEMRNMPISLPSISVQQRIVAKLDTLRSHLTELEQKYNLIVANCDALKQAILRETFE